MKETHAYILLLPSSLLPAPSLLLPGHVCPLLFPCKPLHTTLLYLADAATILLPLPGVRHFICQPDRFEPFLHYLLYGDHLLYYYHAAVLRFPFYGIGFHCQRLSVSRLSCMDALYCFAFVTASTSSP